MRTLSDLMELDRIVIVDGDGGVESNDNEYAPGAYTLEHEDGTWSEPEVDGDEWKLLTGFTGQWGYNGASMHSSECMGGRLERYILETPGHYVALAVYPIPLAEDGDNEPDSWVIAYHE